jgi:hypothetical protein
MNLGKKLKQTLIELEKARVEGIERQAKAAELKIRRERQEIEDRLNKIKDSFVTQIEMGEVPSEKIKNYSQQRWFMGAKANKIDHQDLWDNFAQFWRSEGLEIELVEEHDGMGMESWIRITLTVDL